MTRAPRQPQPQRQAVPLSAVFAAPEGLRPQVGRRDPAWRFTLACIGVGCFGAAVFADLSHGRLQASPAQARVQPAPAPEPAAAPRVPAAPPPAPPPSAPAAVSAPAAPPPQPDTSPALVLDLSDQGAPDAAAMAAAAAARGGSPATPSGLAPGSVGTPDERFADRITSSRATTVRATRLPNTALIAPQGTVIPAVLETALNSDLPGFASAIVSRDVRGYDNTTVLIPKGSKLVGQYKSALQAGQSRAFVVWSRLLTPDGISIDLGSPATDELGRGGLSGETNTHFWRRFGGSLLTSVITAGLTAAAASAGSGGGTAIILNSPNQAGAVAGQAFAQDANIPPTISVKPGAAIRVFVARDLDFSSVVPRKPE